MPLSTRSNNYEPVYSVILAPCNFRHSTLANSFARSIRSNCCTMYLMKDHSRHKRSPSLKFVR